MFVFAGLLLLYLTGSVFVGAEALMLALAAAVTGTTFGWMSPLRDPSSD